MNMDGLPHVRLGIEGFNFQELALGLLSGLEEDHSLASPGVGDGVVLFCHGGWG